MLFKSISAILFLSGAVLAKLPHPCPHPGSFEYWKAPGPDDVRGPCPMLNVMANHGFLPHDGKKISQELTRQAMAAALNIEADFSDSMFSSAVLTSPLPNSTTFDLNDLNRHNILEHDGSLSRADAYYDPNQPFNQTVFDQSMSFYVNSTIDVQQLGNAITSRVHSSRTENPTFFMNITASIISVGESAAMVLALGDRWAGTVSRDRFEYVFQHERLPLEFGWSRPTIPLTQDQLNNITTGIIQTMPQFPAMKARMVGGLHAGLHAGMFK